MGFYRFLVAAGSFSSLFLLLFNASLSAQNSALQEISRLDSLTQSDSLTIDKIFIIGNRKTRNSIIERELSISEGKIVARSNLDELLEQERNKLLNTSLFLDVDFNVIPVNDERIDIILRLYERWYLFPIPIFELADRNFNEWWTNQGRDLSRINYGLKLYQYNVRGRNETLRLTAQFGFTRQFQLYYSFPFIDKSQKLGLTLFGDFSENNNLNFQTIDHRQRDLDSLDVNSWIMRRTRFGASFTYRRSFYNRHHFSFNFLKNRIRDTVAILNPDYFLNGRSLQKYFRFSYTFRRDLRDFTAYPLNGFFLEASIDKLGLGIFDDINQLEMNILYSRYMNLGKNFYFSTNFGAKTTFPDRQPYFNNNAIGYNPFVLRGYELYVVEGQHFLINRNTLKMKLFSLEQKLHNLINIKQFQTFPIAVYLKTYLDNGYVFSNTPVPENIIDYTNELIYGYGFGLDIVTFYDIVFRWEYSFNAEGESGLFFGIKSEF